METKKSFIEKFYEEFSFLMEDDLDYLYLQAMYLATSVRNLGAIHKLLPDNCRLLRNDFVKLCKLWKEYCSPYFTANIKKKKNQNKKIKRMEQQEIIEMFEVLCSKSSERKVFNVPFKRPEKNLVSYYSARIMEKSKLKPDTVFVPAVDGYKIFSTFSAKKHGNAHFYSEIFNKQVDISCFIYPEKYPGKMIVQLRLLKSLTGKLTHQLMSQMKEYSASVDSQHINFFYFFPEEDFKDCLQVVKGRHPSDCINVVNEKFVGKLQTALKEIGIQIGTISPIIYGEGTVASIYTIYTCIKSYIAEAPVKLLDDKKGRYLLCSECDDEEVDIYSTESVLEISLGEKYPLIKELVTNGRPIIIEVGKGPDRKREKWTLLDKMPDNVEK